MRFQPDVQCQKSFKINNPISRLPFVETFKIQEYVGKQKSSFAEYDIMKHEYCGEGTNVIKQNYIKWGGGLTTGLGKTLIEKSQLRYL